MFVGVVRDITERKQSEEQERHYRQTLEWAVRDRTRELQEQTAALEEARLDTLHRLAMAGEYHDEDTHLHTERVGVSAAEIARAYGSTRDFVELIRLAAPLHDLGKLALSDTILLKKGPLTDEQWEHVKTHPVVGAAILAGSTSEVLRLAEEIALTHHEWWNGSGYPAGLRGTEIPLSGRIVTLADTFDALTHDRPYKPAWPIERAIDEIQKLAARDSTPPSSMPSTNSIPPGSHVTEPAQPSRSPRTSAGTRPRSNGPPSTPTPARCLRTPRASRHAVCAGRSCGLETPSVWHDAPYSIPGDVLTEEDCMAFEELKERHAAMWGAGPFEQIADTLTEMHDVLVAAVEPSRAMRGSTSAVAPVSLRFARRRPARQSPAVTSRPFSSRPLDARRQSEGWRFRSRSATPRTCRTRTQASTSSPRRSGRSSLPITHGSPPSWPACAGQVAGWRLRRGRPTAASATSSG